MIEAKSKCIGGGLEFADCAIVLNRPVEYIRRRIQTRKGEALWAHAAGRNAIFGKGETLYRDRRSDPQSKKFR